MEPLPPLASWALEASYHIWQSCFLSMHSCPPQWVPSLLAAIGAVAVTGLGVLAVFQMAQFVAAGTGRSINAEERSRDAEENRIKK